VLLSVNVRYLKLVGSVAAFVDTVSRGVGVVLLLGWLLGKARDILACMEAVWSKHRKSTFPGSSYFERIYPPSWQQHSTNRIHMTRGRKQRKHTVPALCLPAG
jgi:hypothetical protein